MRLIDKDDLINSLGIPKDMECCHCEWAYTYGGCIRVALSDVCFSIENAEEVERWIPVTDTERLPKVGQAVLWCDDQGNVFTTAITYKEGSSWKVGNRHSGANIVAWMEPPKPFKGE